MISCRPHYIPREFSSVFFIAVYIPPQTDAGTKSALNGLYSAISKQENTHPEAAFTLFTHDCMARNNSNTIIKFADDTTVVVLITDKDEISL